jgi:hypothetical protein
MPRLSHQWDITRGGGGVYCSGLWGELELQSTNLLLCRPSQTPHLTLSPTQLSKRLRLEPERPRGLEARGSCSPASCLRSLELRVRDRVSCGKLVAFVGFNKPACEKSLSNVLFCKNQWLNITNRARAQAAAVWWSMDTRVVHEQHAHPRWQHG